MTTHGTARERRKDRATELFAGSDLFIVAITCMPAFLFNPSLAFRAAQFMLFWLFAWALGKRVSVLVMAIAFFGITAFNLLLPYGLELARIGPLRITAGALEAGLERAISVEGLILLSRSTVRSDLILPGKLGALMGRSFRYFDRIMERRGGFDRSDPIGGIDRLMIELWEERADDLTQTPIKYPQRRPIGRIILGCAATAVWGLFFAGLVFLG